VSTATGPGKRAAGAPVRDPSTPRRGRSDGARSRAAILKGATELATLEGLEGLSIGRLADHIGMSKSGVFAHFGSKEELQLATIEAAQEIFEHEVVRPALAYAPGLAQLLEYSEAYLSYLERRVFPGGCFFACVAAEVDSRDGAVTDELRELMAGGLVALADMVRDAQARGEVDAGSDPAQVAFEIDSLLHGANAGFNLYRSDEPLERARRAIRNRLAQP
jgi:AcrR family transcriptional regulator